MSLLLLFMGGGSPPPPDPVAASEITNRPFFAWGNLADSASLTGGAWTEALPLANLKNRKQARVARSTNSAPASTQMIIDLGANAIWRVIAFAAHNVSMDGTWRVTAHATDPSVSAPSYDSGVLQAWPAVYDTDDLEWENDNFWSGQYSAAEAKGLNPTLVHRPPQFRGERYVKVEFTDPTNVDSFVQAGRLFIADGWSPSQGIKVGATFGVSDETEVQKAYGGAESFDEKRRRREATIEIAPLEEAESYSKAFEMMRQAGISGEVLFIWKGTDTVRALQRQFLGRLQRLSPIQHPYPTYQSVGFFIGELL